MFGGPGGPGRRDRQRGLSRGPGGILVTGKIPRRTATINQAHCNNQSGALQQSIALFGSCHSSRMALTLSAAEA